LFPSVPRRSLEELRDCAELFLREYHPVGTIPVPIEEIIELTLGLEIRPIRGLRQRFSIDGFLTTDLETIVVDEELMTRDSYRSRYRFTLAHEVGHLVLHAEQVQAVIRDTPEEWKAAVRSIPPGDYSSMEFQAYEFAGRVLVPLQPLETLYQEACHLAEERGIDLVALQDAHFAYVAGWIAKRFHVSAPVVEKRLIREGIGRSGMI
jgi:IrrE N-terminal-like domain